MQATPKTRPLSFFESGFFSLPMTLLFFEKSKGCGMNFVGIVYDTCS